MFKNINIKAGELYRIPFKRDFTDNIIVQQKEVLPQAEKKMQNKPKTKIQCEEEKKQEVKNEIEMGKMISSEDPVKRI